MQWVYRATVFDLLGDVSAVSQPGLENVTLVASLTPRVALELVLMALQRVQLNDVTIQVSGEEVNKLFGSIGYWQDKGHQNPASG